MTARGTERTAMTRLATGTVSVLSAVAAVLMLRYALTAEIPDTSSEAALAAAAGLACRPLAMQPLPIGSAAAARAAFDEAARIAFAPKRR